MRKASGQQQEILLRLLDSNTFVSLAAANTSCRSKYVIIMVNESFEVLTNVTYDIYMFKR